MLVHVDWEISRGGDRSSERYQCRGNQGLEPTCSDRFPFEWTCPGFVEQKFKLLCIKGGKGTFGCISFLKSKKYTKKWPESQGNGRNTAVSNVQKSREEYLTGEHEEEEIGRCDIGWKIISFSVLWYSVVSIAPWCNWQHV